MSTTPDIDRKPHAAWPIIALLSLVAIALGPVVFNGFTAWDDRHTIAQNPEFDPPTFAGVVQFWNIRNPTAGLWVPLTYTTWAAIAWISRAIHGSLVAWPFHLASVCLHVVSSVLVFAILRRLISRDASTWAAFFGAAIFALHPMQVEPVAWASGLKDILAGALALAAIYAHLHPQRARQLLAAALFVLAMLAKPSAVNAIGVALIIDVLLVRSDLTRRLPWLLAWLALSIPVVIVARHVQVTVAHLEVPFAQRFLVAADALAFYAFKLVVPLKLGIDYGRAPMIVLATGGAARVTWIVPVVIAASLAIMRSRWLIAATLLFVAGVSSNLGFTPFQFQGHSTVADHYVSFAMLGPAIVAAHLFERARVGAVRLIFAAMLILVLGGLSYRQTRAWRDSRSLFTHAIDVNPDSIASRNNLGRTLAESGDLDGGAVHFEYVLSIDPTEPDAHRNLAVIAYRRHDLNTAIDHRAAAIRFSDPENPNGADDQRSLEQMLLERERNRAEK